jgi:hypothetical protein
LCKIIIAAVSKPQIALVDKAQADEKARHTRQYVSPPEAASILKRPATPPSGVRWGFETSF